MPKASNFVFISDPRISCKSERFGRPECRSLRNGLPVLQDMVRSSRISPYKVRVQRESLFAGMSDPYPWAGSSVSAEPCRSGLNRRWEGAGCGMFHQPDSQGELHWQYWPDMPARIYEKHLEKVLQDPIASAAADEQRRRDAESFGVDTLLPHPEHSLW